jgi:hypothetical protein
MSIYTYSETVLKKYKLSLAIIAASTILHETTGRKQKLNIYGVNSEAVATLKEVNDATSHILNQTKIVWN